MSFNIRYKYFVKAFNTFNNILKIFNFIKT